MVQIINPAKLAKAASGQMGNVQSERGHSTYRIISQLCTCLSADCFGFIACNCHLLNITAGSCFSEMLSSVEKRSLQLSGEHSWAFSSQTFSWRRPYEVWGDVNIFAKKLIKSALIEVSNNWLMKLQSLLLIFCVCSYKKQLLHYTVIQSPVNKIFNVSPDWSFL